MEAVTVRLVGADRQRIVAEAVRLLEDETAYLQMAQAVNPYSDGQTGRRITAALLGELIETLIPAHRLNQDGADGDG
jgi:UDP-N-acetylglucosamine 2-epimerase (non-hydrolysing)